MSRIRALASHPNDLFRAAAMVALWMALHIYAARPLLVAAAAGGIAPTLAWSVVLVIPFITMLPMLSRRAFPAKVKEKLDNAMSGGSEEKTYSINGQVTAFNRANNTLTIIHAPIPGSLKPNRENTYELGGQNVESLNLSGSIVFATATLHKRGRASWLTDVTVSSPPGRP